MENNNLIAKEGFTKELEDRTNELTEANNTIIDQIEELRRTNEELICSNAELQKFAYITSHDLKAPLRAIVNLANWIAEDAAQGKDISLYVLKLTGRVKRMENLINGLLEYSKIGRMHVEEESVDTNDIVAKIKDDYPKMIINNQLPVIKNGNKIRLHQVFSNLIDNAFKHHDVPEEAVVKVSCQEKEETYYFCIEDNGPGIDTQYHKRIFEIFQTLKPRDELESTGIGLSIVKKIIEESGGTIWVDSKINCKPDRGTKFYFTIHK